MSLFWAPPAHLFPFYAGSKSLWLPAKEAAQRKVVLHEEGFKADRDYRTYGGNRAFDDWLRFPDRRRK
jgi:hypothetical protein